MLRSAAGRPGWLLRASTIGVLLCSLLAAALALRTPLASVRAVGAGDGTVLLEDGRARRAVPDDRLVRFDAADGSNRVELPARLLPDIAEPRGDRAANRAFWDGRDRLAAMLARGPVRVEAGGGPVMVATATRHRIGTLPPNFWVPLLSGAAGVVIGLWVWILRPGEWAARVFGIGGIGFFVGCATMAVASGSGLGLEGTLKWWLMVANYAGTAVYGVSLAVLFARFPLPLVGTRPLWPLLLLNGAAAAAVAFDWTPAAIDLMLLVAMFDCCVMAGLALWQGWRGRHDPRHRAVLLPIALSLAVSAFAFSLLSMGTMLFGAVPIMTPEFSTPVLLLMDVGLALAITRARLFTLGRWAFRLLLSAAAVAVFVLVDAFLLASVTRERDVALFLSAVAGIVVYLPVREWAMRRLDRLREGQARDLLRHAGTVALDRTPGAADAAWRSAVAAMFDPLEIAAGARHGDRPATLDRGAALYLPSPLDGGALVLRHAAGGTRLFAADDVATAATFTGFVRQLIEARDGYTRGVLEERSRIARDLHDDVGARLLTSLHRHDTRAVQDDVRGAIADMRMIITGLSGVPRSLADLFGALRLETQERMAAAGIGLSWPLDAGAATSVLSVDYARQRGILSIVRECVTNVIRHSAAASAVIEVAAAEGTLVVVIRDDGRGLRHAQPGGHGLANARRRAGEFGGAFDIASDAGGTVARLSVPLS